MTKLRRGLLIITIILLGCNEKSKTVDNFKSHKIKRLESIRDSLGFVSLPFKANFDSLITPTYRMLPFNEDSVFRKDFNKLGDVYLVGFLPDTTNFYGIVFIGVASIQNPGLITFDKNGHKVNSVFLTEENCVIYSGDILLCQEFTTINRNLTLDYYFKSIVSGEGESTDTVCYHSVRKGQINKEGKIDLGQMKKIECE